MTEVIGALRQSEYNLCWEKMSLSAFGELPEPKGTKGGDRFHKLHCIKSLYSQYNVWAGAGLLFRLAVQSRSRPEPRPRLKFFYFAMDKILGGHSKSQRDKTRSDNRISCSKTID